MQSWEAVSKIGHDSNITAAKGKIQSATATGFNDHHYHRLAMVVRSYHVHHTTRDEVSADNKVHVKPQMQCFIFIFQHFRKSTNQVSQ
jgi:hypothetical protein